jgi:hypothetical protein
VGVCVGIGVAIGVGPKHALVPVLIAYYGVLGFVSIWLFYRIYRQRVRFDDQGIVVRNFSRSYRLGWPEVSHFADGNLVMRDQGGSMELWALQIVLYDERAVTAAATMRIPWTAKKESPSLPKVLATLEQVAAHYRIPAQLTGKPR